MKLNKVLKLSSLLVVASVLFNGCAQQTAQQTTSSASSAPAPKAKAYGYSEADFETDLLTLDKKVLMEHSVGDTITYEYVVTAKENIKDVTVMDIVPSGLSYISSTPNASVSGTNVSWNLGEMDAGSEATVSMQVKANSVGKFTNCATATAIPQACTVVVIGEPKITIQKDVAVSKLFVGETANFEIVVQNIGTSVAKNVVVTDLLPSSLTTSAPLSYNIGDLAPGESKSISLAAQTTAKGDYCNVAEAVGSNVSKVSDDACIVVVKPGLAIEKTGTKEQFTNKNADYDIVVTNTGDVELVDVVVTDTPSAPMTIVSAPGATIAGNTASWNIPSLAAGASKSFSVKVTSAQGGTYCNTATATDADLNLSATDDACTTWKGFPAVLLEVIDTTDPLLIGEKSTYVIEVTNQGTADDFNVVINAMIPAEFKITGVSGASQGTVTGNNVSFAPYAVIKPKQVIEYRIDIEAVKEGSARSKFTLDTALLSGDPISETEATQVY